jgi:hypothetical protein
LRRQLLALPKQHAGGAAKRNVARLTPAGRVPMTVTGKIRKDEMRRISGDNLGLQAAATTKHA